jgi:hypothetical protein
MASLVQTDADYLFVKPVKIVKFSRLSWSSRIEDILTAKRLSQLPIIDDNLTNHHLFLALITSNDGSRAILNLFKVFFLL